MKTGRFRVRAWALLAGSLAIGACSHTSSLDTPSNVGGAAGAGGQDPSGGAPAACQEQPDCVSFGDCATDLMDLAARCDSSRLTRYATKCGGTYVESDEGVTSSSWLFDVTGKLIGGSYEGEGSCSFWGSPSCASVGQGVSLCECVAHDSCSIWGANFDCPATLDDVEAECDLGDITIERSESDCGGTYVHASNGIQTSEWTFDATGKLIGAASVGDVRDCDYWGKRCQPVGKPQSLCATGGAGGVANDGETGGAGGAGGAR